MSFRSTEFIDDAARDNKATNVLEIKETGFAWGQIADMQAWYAKLKSDPALLGGGQAFSVTGYSLGGHLATVFNLLNQDAAQRVVTFNGAGVGRVNDGTLQSAVNEFNDLRGSTDALAAKFTEPGLADIYRDFQAKLAAGTMTAAQAQAALKAHYSSSETGNSGLTAQASMLMRALKEIQAIEDEAVRVTTLVQGGTGEGANSRPKQVLPSEIAGVDLNYRLAMQYAARHTLSASVVSGATRGFGDKQYDGRLANQYDVVGDTTPSVVANSQWHYGQDVRIGIEDQPLVRGGLGGDILMDAIALKDPDLLVDGYALKDFGDTHSLVLLVDSLSVQSTLLSLLPEGERSADNVRALMKTVYKAATYQKRVDGDLISGSSQGKAEGDLLENLVNSLADMLLGPGAQADLKGNAEGGTWARTDDQDGYMGRNRFFAVIEAIQKGIDDMHLAGQFGLATTVDRPLEASARSDFGAYLALRTLSPFTFKTAQALQDAQDAIGKKWGAVYDTWKADRAALAQTGRTDGLQISDEWLADRSAMLARKNWFGTSNTDPLNLSYRPPNDARTGSAYQMEDTFYEDMESGYKIRQGAVTNATRYITFGDAAGNTLTGRRMADRLYGGAGDDILDGGEGSDYLEGGSGRDVYRFNGKFGHDVVRDEGGAGVLEFDGAAMPLEVRKRYGSDDNWESLDGKFLFTRVPADSGGGRTDLHITKYTSATDKTVQGTVTIRGYSTGDFGLTLGSTEEAVSDLAGPKSSLVVLAADPSDPSLPAGEGVARLFDSKASLRYTGKDDAAKWVFASESDGGQIIETGAGDDRIFLGRTYESPEYQGAENWGPKAGEDEDHVIAGAGNDLVLTGYGSDVIEGGDGDDRLYSAMIGYYSQVNADGSAVSRHGAVVQNHDPDDAGSSDWVDGGAGNDEIRGGMGGDVLLGGTGDDGIAGMEGDDLIIGGEGNDGLYGDGVYDPQATEFIDGKIGAYNHRGNDTIYGGAGKDYIVGGVGSDQLFGGEGDDQIYGDNDGPFVATGNNITWIPGQYHGDDTIDGGDGNDGILGGGGSDVLLGGAGNDLIHGDQSDVILLDAQYHGDDRIDGGEGNDILYGDGGADTVIGGAGDDYLNGGEGNDILWGGAGQDRLYGGLGDDVYRFEKGDIEQGRKEIIVDEGGTDRIEFTAGLSAQDLYVRRVGGEIVLSMAGGGSLGVQGDIRVIESVQFSDGTQWSSADLVREATRTSDGGDTVQTVVADSAVDGGKGDDSLTGDDWKDTLLGGAGDDTLQGKGGDDVLDGGAGNDKIMGGSGRDTVLFGRGDGRDDYYAGAAAQGSGDVLRLKEGVALSDLVLLRAQDDLVVRIAGGTDQLIAHSAFSTQALDRLEFADGSVVALADLKLASGQSQATEGNDVIYLPAGGDTVNALGGNDTVQGGAGNDTIDGGEGDDLLRGDAGNDVLTDFRGDNTFDGGDGDDRITGTGSSVYAGAGNDTVDVPDATLMLGTGDDTVVLRKASGAPNRYARLIDGDLGATAQRTIRFASGIAPSDVAFSSVSTQGRKDLRVTWPGATADRPQALHVEGFMDFSQAARAGFRFVFEDAPDTVWSFDDVFRRANSGTPGDDALRGTDADDTLSGLAGNDTIDGLAGNDVLDGGAGFDTLRGGTGNDVLRAGEGGPGGTDVLYGDDGDDTLYAAVGGASTEMRGGAGADTFHVGAGGGTHTIMRDDAVAQDVLEFDASIAPGDVRVRRSGDGAALQVKDPVTGAVRTTVMIVGLFATAQPGGVAKVRFAGDPSTVWTVEDLRQRALIGEKTADELAGFDFADDLLTGGAGNDVLAGQGGNDVYLYRPGDGRDVITETSGNDTLRFGAGISAADVRLVRTSSTPADWRGESTYYKATDTLVVALPDGGQVWIPGFFTEAGALETFEFADGTRWNAQDIQARITDVRGTANAQQGSTSDDIYTVDHPDDSVAEGANQGQDIIRSSVSYTLPDNVENLTLTGTLDIAGIGNGVGNVIVGNAGNNVLNGMGGIDRLEGGAGDDVYVDLNYNPYNSDQDQIVEQAGGGYDTLLLDAQSRRLPDNVEKLVLVDWSNSVRRFSTNPFFGFQHSYRAYDAQSDDTRVWLGGNSQDNVIDATNEGRISQAMMRDRSSYFGGVVLDGGEGNDTMIGGAEDNFYVVDSLGDKVIETGGKESQDTIVSSRISVDLAGQTGIENIELLGSSEISATGDDNANTIRGSRNTARNVLAGKGGDDTYYVGLNDVVVETAGGGTDRVILDVTAMGQAAWRSSGKVFHLDDYANVENIAANGKLRGQDAAQGIHLVGNAGNNTISGSFQDDIVDGGDGDDVVEDQYAAIVPGDGPGYVPMDQDELKGGAGNDRLVSYAGLDTMDGGAGDDVLVGGDIYLFGRGDGNDTIESWTGSVNGGRTQTLRFKSGVGAQDVLLQRDGDALKVSLRGSQDSITVRSFYSQNASATGVRRIEFADGTAWGYDTLVRRADPTVVNHAPVLASPLPDVRAAAGTAFQMSVPAGTFTDPDANDALGYRASLKGGGALPSWLRFDAGTGLLSGTPAVTDAGTLDVVLTASDSMGAEVSDQFTITVASPNRAPVVNGYIPEQGATKNMPFRFTIPDGLFVDPDAGDHLTFSVSMSYGEWPAWLTFDAATRTFSGTPAAMDGGKDARFIVRATDTAGGWNAAEFSLFVNQPPESRKTIAAQSFKQGSAWSYTVPAGTFVDDDADEILTYSASLSDGAALPAWLTFDAKTQAFKAGSNAPVGSYDIAIKVQDYWGASVSQRFSITVQAGAITGTSRNDTLTGTSGNDTIDGLAGADTMSGLAGDDTYIVDNTGDKVVESANAGTDTVMSSVTYTLPSNVENLVLTGSSAINGTGNALDNRLTGNAGANVLTGGAGADYLDGGAGADTLAGGLGNDTYWLARGHGTDTVQENDTTSGNLDTAKFAGDVSSRQLWFRKSGNNLEVSVIGTSDKFLVTDWYLGSRYQVERFEAGDGKALQASQVQNLVQAMASFSPPAAGQTQLPANYQSKLETTLAANWK
ncbi:Ig family protein [Paracidovorax avenae ATCC 19860]|uniref:Ig family protein n=1 Tax=Paracidovorax avenae (strain ATCC 19860 / DSM 7227 / CCUG 15838 / JCM 20985 / LMG 2117 / NCPPB 1011) TaxID=643561 RepID=F0QBW3_PARA1|nr:putative Ig domain-containing protein [Paracidovorax avenae]ADX48579.1 Ig family protein [Paracidovorax avenae ATCC 19860]